MKFAFPCDHDVPAVLLKGVPCRKVALNIAVELALPEFDVGFWHVCNLAPLVPMPKATMDENCDLMLAEDDVRLAREVLGMEAVTKAKRMQCPS